MLYDILTVISANLALDRSIDVKLLSTRKADNTIASLAMILLVHQNVATKVKWAPLRSLIAFLIQ
jgi:hypothetical protein